MSKSLKLVFKNVFGFFVGFFPVLGFFGLLFLNLYPSIAAFIQILVGVVAVIRVDYALLD